MSMPKWITEPADLAPEALEVWKSLAPSAFRDGFLKESNAHELVAACRFIVLARKSAAAIEAEGVLIGTKSGVTKLNPAIAALRMAEIEIAKRISDFVQDHR